MKGRLWTPDEDAYLRSSYARTPIAELIRTLNTSVDRIRHRARRLGLQTCRYWTRAEDDQLRAGWGNINSRLLAAQLDRPYNATKQRAMKLGLDSGRWYTDEQKDLVRSLYHVETAAAIAQKVFGSRRSARAVWTLAKKMGLRKWPHWDPEVLDAVRRLYAEGLVDMEIAVRLPQYFKPDDEGRRQVTHIRRERLRLPTNPEARLRRRREIVAKQFKTLGITSPGQLRAHAYRKFAVANGWPADLRPREVQILNVLAERGPQTAHDLAVAIGMPTAPFSTGTRRILLADCGRCTLDGECHGTYTARLLKLGLIVSLTRWTSGRGKGKNRLPNLYLLALKAIAILEQKGQIHAEQHHLERGQPVDASA